MGLAGSVAVGAGCRDNHSVFLNEFKPDPCHPLASTPRRPHGCLKHRNLRLNVWQDTPCFQGLGCSLVVSSVPKQASSHLLKHLQRPGQQFPFGPVEPLEDAWSVVEGVGACPVVPGTQTDCLVVTCLLPHAHPLADVMRLGGGCLGGVARVAD